MERKTEITKEQLSRIVNINVQSALLKVVTENAEFLRDYFKMREKQTFKNSVKLMDDMLKNFKSNSNEFQQLEGLGDIMHDCIYTIKQEYRKEIEKKFIVK